jgi:hypothetical protein
VRWIPGITASLRPAERGIIHFVYDPQGDASNEKPLIRFAHYDFCFHPFRLRQAWPVCLKTKIPLFSGRFFIWRREGDSNPRYSYPYGSLANCWFKPLTHLSLRTPILSRKKTLTQIYYKHERDKSRKT